MPENQGPRQGKKAFFLGGVTLKTGIARQREPTGNCEESMKTGLRAMDMPEEEVHPEGHLIPVQVHTR